MKNNQMFVSVPLKRWAFLYPKRTNSDSQVFLGLLKEVAKGMGYEMADPKIVEMDDDRVGTYSRHLQDLISKDPKMIMIVVPNNAGDRYAAIKRLTCVNNAIPTQVIVSKTMMPKKGNIAGVKSIATKVMIQINCKLGRIKIRLCSKMNFINYYLLLKKKKNLGGAPWMIKFPLKGVMAVGFDVTHDTSDRSKSYGAFVASMDLKETVNFFSAVSPHKDGEELSSNIALHMLQATKEFKDQHGALPERIFYYRDGVGDGQVSVKKVLY